MKRTVFFLFLLFSISLSFAQNDTLNRTDARGRKQGYWIKKEKGKKIYEGRFRDNRPQGEFKYYYPDGKIQNISRFEKNGSVSYTTIYHNNGRIAATGKHFYEAKDSVWNYFNYGGKLIKVESYKNGLPDGTWEIYDNSTQNLLEERNYKAGKKHGIWKSYYTNAQLRYEISYNNNVMQGSYKCFYHDGKPWHTGYYNNDFIDSVWVTYDRSGKMAKRKKIRDGKTLEYQFFAYNRGVSTLVSADSVAYVVAFREGVEFVYWSGKKVNTSTDISEFSEFFSDLDFIPLSDKLYVRALSLRNITPYGRNAYKVEIYPKFPFEIIVKDDFAKNLKTITDKTTIED